MDRYKNQRIRMVNSQIRSRGVRDERVLKAMETVPRHLFVDEGLRDQAYNDSPLPIGENQTISQPYIVALMTEALELTGRDKVLEIGTGSGYQTAILALLAERVLSIERLPFLATRARKIIESLKLFNVAIRVGDGTLGWQDEAPFDAILVAAGSPDIPKTFLEQLAVGGRLVIPVGDQHSQQLVRAVRKSKDVKDVEIEDMGGCRFVKLIGEYGWQAK